MYLLTAKLVFCLKEKKTLLCCLQWIYSDVNLLSVSVEVLLEIKVLTLKGEICKQDIHSFSCFLPSAQNETTLPPVIANNDYSIHVMLRRTTMQP